MSIKLKEAIKLIGKQSGDYLSNISVEQIDAMLTALEKITRFYPKNKRPDLGSIYYYGQLFTEAQQAMHFRPRLLKQWEKRVKRLCD